MSTHKRTHFNPAPPPHTPTPTPTPLVFSPCSWAGSACTSPVFAEVVPSQLRSLVYSFDRAFEGGRARLGQGTLRGRTLELLQLNTFSLRSNTPTSQRSP